MATLSETLGKLGTAVRGVLGTDGKMTLSIMANNLVVAQSAIQSAYNKIASMGGTVPEERLVFGLTNAIGTIPTGSSVQRSDGTFTTDSNGNVSVSTGFKPDIIFIQGYAAGTSSPRSLYGITVAYSLDSRFSESGGDRIIGYGLSKFGDIEFYCVRSDTGFTGQIFGDDSNPMASNSFVYAAIRYTE